MAAPLPLSSSALAIRRGIFADLAPRIEAHARAGGDLIELHIGDTYRRPPEAATFASIEAPSSIEAPAFDHALYRYGDVAGLAALREAFAARLVSRGHGPASIDPARDVMVTCGATHALFCGARAIFEPGDEVLVATPCWPLATGVLRAAGAVPVEVPLTTRLYADPSLDAASVLEQAATPRTRAIYFITPNNPDGKVLSRGQLASIAAFAVARDFWVIADEVYADYVYDGEHGSIARRSGMADRTLGAYSLSKSHGLAGARVGFLVAPERVVQVARRVATHTVFHAPVAAQRVALAALSAPGAEMPDPWVEEARRAYRDARDEATGALGGAGVRVFRPEGGSYAFIDFSPVLGGRPLSVLLERCIDRGVLLTPGEASGAAFAAWARLCFTSVPKERLLEGVARIRQAIHDIEAPG